jgi:flagellar basal body rod protein FlgB
MNINTSLSGIKNAFLRQDVAANNVANINTKNYQAKGVLNVEQKNGGVEGITVKTNAPSNHDNNNVSLVDEMVGQLNNVNQEKANVNVLKSQNEMIGSIIDLKA